MNDPTPWLSLREEAGAVTFQVKVAPRAARERVLGVQAGALKVALTAPPVDGAANQALLQFVAHLLGVPVRDVSLLHGERARIKTLRVSGMDAASVRAVLEPRLATRSRGP